MPLVFIVVVILCYKLHYGYSMIYIYMCVLLRRKMSFITVVMSMVVIMVCCGKVIHGFILVVALC